MKGRFRSSIHWATMRFSYLCGFEELAKNYVRNEKTSNKFKIAQGRWNPLNHYFKLYWHS